MKTKIVMTVVVSIMVFLANNVQATDYLVEEGDNIFEIDLINGDSLIMTGGILGTLDSYDTCESVISGGEISYINNHVSSITSIYGGNILYLTGFDSSMIYLHGGSIDHGMGMDGSSIVHLYGYAFNYEPLGGDFNDGLVSGYWADDSTFSISLKNWQTPTYDHIVFHEIPEPTSFSLLAAGIWGMYKKKHISENNSGNLV